MSLLDNLLDTPEVGRAQAVAENEQNIFLNNRYLKLLREGKFEEARASLQPGYVPSEEAASAGPAASGLLSSLGSADAGALQGLLSQFRRAEEERQFADAGHDEAPIGDHERDEAFTTGGGWNYNPESAYEQAYHNMTAAERQEIIDAGKNANVVGSGVKGLFSLATRVPIGGASFFDEFGKYRAGQRMESIDKFMTDMSARGKIDPASEAAKLEFMNSRGGESLVNTVDPGLLRAVEAQQAAAQNAAGVLENQQAGWSSPDQEYRYEPDVSDDWNPGTMGW